MYIWDKSSLCLRHNNVFEHLKRRWKCPDLSYMYLDVSNVMKWFKVDVFSRTLRWTLCFMQFWVYLKSYQVSRSYIHINASRHLVRMLSPPWSERYPPQPLERMLSPPCSEGYPSVDLKGFPFHSPTLGEKVIYLLIIDFHSNGSRKWEEWYYWPANTHTHTRTHTPLDHDSILMVYNLSFKVS